MRRAQRPVRVRSQFRFLPCHTGFNPYEVILSPATVGSLVLDWKYTTGGAVSSSPAVANGVAYVGSDDDDVYALEATTGALLWKHATGAQIESSPAIADNVVYVGSDDDNLYALDASTGALLWKYTTGGIAGCGVCRPYGTRFYFPLDPRASALGQALSSRKAGLVVVNLQIPCSRLAFSSGQTKIPP